MRFDATEEQRQLQATTRRFLEETAPLTTVRLWGDKNPGGFDRDWWRRAADLGWTSLLVPESQGGSAGEAGLGGVADLAIVAEERGRMVAPGPLLPVSVAAWTLAMADADSEAKVACQQTLEAILSGDAVCSWVVGEGEGHGDGDGDGKNKQSWLTAPPPVAAVSRGTSLELSGAAHAVESGADSDSFVVAVKMGDDVLHVLVPAEVAGLRRERVRSLDLVRRHADLIFDGVVVPAASVIVGAARGRSALENQRNIANIVQCAEMVGAAERAFEMTLEYTADRSSFGRPLASYQVLKHRLADMKLWIEASQAAVEGAVAAVAAVAALTAVVEETASASQLVSAAKLYVGRKAPDIVQDCIQMHGGIGVTWEHDLHLYLRRVTTDRQLLGTPGDHALHLASLIGL
jgi:alkylation response protein AidB-like acyl-CoA dehydrogenase